MSRFSGVEGCPPVEIFALGKAYKEDPHPQKVDLGIGAYRNNEGKPWILPVVRKAELEIASDETLNHEYLGQLGLDEFSRNATALLLGPDSPAIKEERAFGVQTLSGTGALRVGTDFLKLRANFNTIYVSNPTWGNHNLLSKMSGFTNDNIRSYRYWDKQNRKLDFDGMVEDMKSAPEDSVFLLHCCAHNPTGMDPTQEQWETIANIMQERKLFPFFDCAYQGFASGDLEKDSSIVRYFVSRGFELLCAQSFAKNFGLYNERVGNLTFVLKDKTPIVNVKAQLTILVRGNYSNPPAHGARVVAKVLSNPQLTEEWKDNIRTMANRIKDMRQQLKVKLDELGTPGTWDHITTQIGMFSYTGLNPSQVEYLVKQYHIYLPKDGRISLCGLNTNNVEYVAKAIDDAVRKFP